MKLFHSIKAFIELQSMVLEW